MFLPYMARRDRPELTDNGRNPSKNGDRVNPRNSELGEYGVSRDIQDVRCAYVALPARIYSSSNTSLIAFQFRSASQWEGNSEPCNLKPER